MKAFRARQEYRHHPGQGRVSERPDAADPIRADDGEGKRRPLLIIPPWINKFYILDLREKTPSSTGRSRRATRVFVISWVNPDEPRRQELRRLYAAKARSPRSTRSRRPPANGGQRHRLLPRRHAARLHARLYGGEERRAARLSATFFVTLVDFAEAGELGVFIDEEQLASLEEQMNERAISKAATWRPPSTCCAPTI